jgi:hypothetical protein
MIERAHDEGHDAVGVDSSDDPTAPEARSLEKEFSRLAAEWKEQSLYMSSPLDMAELPAYQAIIAMGRPAVPLILDDLRRGPDHWFMALGRITGASPVPREDYGRVDLMAEAWIRWGRENGYLA